MTNSLSFEELQELLISTYAQCSEELEAAGLKPLPTIELKVSKAYSFKVLGTTSAIKRGSLYIPESITLYYNALLSYPLEEVIDTIRHEAAHVYTMLNFSYAGHNAIWKKVALALGATPDPRAKGLSLAKQAFSERQLSISKLASKSISLDRRTLHSFRCSLKQLCKQQNLPYSEETFRAYIVPKFENFYSQELLDEACNQLFNS